MASINLNPTDRQLRQFGATALIAVPLIFGVWTRQLEPTGWSMAAGAALAMAGWIRPVLLRPLFVVVTLLTYPIGLIVREIAMLAIFFGMLTPLGLLFRLLGRDVLKKTPDRERESYWNPVKNADSAESYYRQS